MKEEIKNHQHKILKLTGYTIHQYKDIFQSITSKINFIDDVFISDGAIETEFEFTKDVDENDTLFIALANEFVWTGDKKLILGLQAKGFKKIFTTDDLYKKFLQLEYRKEI